MNATEVDYTADYTDEKTGWVVQNPDNVPGASGYMRRERDRPLASYIYGLFEVCASQEVIDAYDASTGRVGKDFINRWMIFRNKQAQAEQAALKAQAEAIEGK